MEEIASLARSSRLPPVEIVNDKSSFKALLTKNWIGGLLSRINEIVTLLGCLEPEKTLQNKCDEIVHLLILCGENNLVREWNNAQVVHDADKIFHLLAKVLGFQAPAELFKMDKIALSLFKELKTKMNKDVMKKFPASIDCFTWAIKFLNITQLEVLVPHILPVCLVLIDDWEVEYQTQGLDTIHHILKENPKSLETFGWYGVIYTSLKKRTHISDNRFYLYECLDICLLNQLPSRLNSIEWHNKNDEYDNLVSNVVQLILVEDSPESLNLNLTILLMLVNSLKVKIARHIHPVLITIEGKVMDDTPEEVICVICSLLDRIMQYCWPSFEDRLCSLLAWLLYKLTNRTGVSTQSVLQTRKSFEIILNKVSPNLTAVLYSDLCGRSTSK